MYVIFDTETTGLPPRYNVSYKDTNNWPRLVQLAWQVYDKDGNKLSEHDLIIKPNGFIIPDDSIKIHGITNEKAHEKGIPLEEALAIFDKSVNGNKYLVAHNINFDTKIVGCEQYRTNREISVYNARHLDTVCKASIEYCAIPANRGRPGFKYPSLTELYKKIFDKTFIDAHNALIDVIALSECFFELQRLNIFGKDDGSEEEASELLGDLFKNVNIESSADDKPFVNLCNHTYHSVLTGAGSIKEYVDLAKEYNQPAVAITDISTMSGTFELFQKSGDIKAIHGVEFFVNEKLLTIKDDVRAQGGSYKLKMYAKNDVGYQNMCRLLYLANTEGYGDTGRICPEWIKDSSEGIIVTTTSYGGKIYEMLENSKVSKAREHFEWLLTTFGKENVYAEIQLGADAQQKVYNNFVIKYANEYKIKAVITNETYFPNEEDWELQHIVSTIKQKMPMDKARLMENSEKYFFKRTDFHKANKDNGYNYPEDFINLCLDRTLEVADRCNFVFETGVEKYPEYEPSEEIVKWAGSRDVEVIIRKMSKVKLDAKLKKNAELGYITLDDESRKNYQERLDFEIQVIKDKKMLHYFMVCWELVWFYEKEPHEGKVMKIGPGRGSAGGSLLAWSLDLIKVDPIRFDLYFERFLNPSRNSPPDLDIDFLKDTDHITNDFLYKKYGKERVLSVGSFSTFNEKGCIKDVARAIIGKSATEAGSPIWKITDEMPDFAKEKISLKDWFVEYPKNSACSDTVREFLLSPDNAKILSHTLRLQGNIRGIGQHAAGVAITPDKCWKYFPTNVIPKKKGEAPSIVTAFQEADGSGKDLSALGILKLDRLKLETINVVEDCIALIKERHDEDIRDTLYHLDLEDENLYNEVRLGLNYGVFQFESSGMGSLIKSMKVDTFDELVACNALYRPGPMGIDAHNEFARNKFHPEEITYVHESLEPILSKTNGVLVYQEQLMFIAHEIGGMSLGDGDYLRRFMANSGDLIQKDLDGLVLTKDEEEDRNYMSFKKYWGMFIEGAKRKGMSDVDLEQVKAYIMKYLGYSFNKCLTENHEVTTETRGKIKLLDVKVGEKVLGYNSKTKKDEFNKVKDIHHNGVKKVYRVKTSSGKVLECTLDHKIMTDQGMKTLQEIKDKKLKVKIIG